MSDLDQEISDHLEVLKELNDLYDKTIVGLKDVFQDIVERKLDKDTIDIESFDAFSKIIKDLSSDSKKTEIQKMNAEQKKAFFQMIQQLYVVHARRMLATAFYLQKIYPRVLQKEARDITRDNTNIYINALIRKMDRHQKKITQKNPENAGQKETSSQKLFEEYEDTYKPQLQAAQKDPAAIKESEWKKTAEKIQDNSSAKDKLFEKRVRLFCETAPLYQVALAGVAAVVGGTVVALAATVLNVIILGAALLGNGGGSGDFSILGLLMSPWKIPVDGFRAIGKSIQRTFNQIMNASEKKAAEEKQATAQVKLRTPSKNSAAPSEEDMEDFNKRMKQAKEKRLSTSTAATTSPAQTTTPAHQKPDTPPTPVVASATQPPSFHRASQTLPFTAFEHAKAEAPRRSINIKQRFSGQPAALTTNTPAASQLAKETPAPITPNTSAASGAASEPKTPPPVPTSPHPGKRPS